MVEEFSSLVSEKIEELCPAKTLKITNLDHEFTTPAIKELTKKKLREILIEALPKRIKNKLLNNDCDHPHFEE